MNTKTTGRNSSLPIFPGNARQRHLPAVPPQLLHIGGLLAALALAWLAMSSTMGQRLALSLGLLGIMFTLLARHPDAAMILMLVYSALLGGMRRWLIPMLDYSPTDPLLIIVPFAITIYLSMFVLQRRIALDTLLSKRLRWLFILMALEMFNPLQGSPVVGIAGALYYLVPLLWFFLGRQIGTTAMVTRLLQWGILIAIIGAVYGLKQTWFGFADSELQWMTITKFMQAFGSTPRPFSFFTQGGEYANFCSTGIILGWVAWLHGRRVTFLFPVPLLLLALFLTSYRSAVVAMLLGCSAVWAVYGRNERVWLLRGALALVIGIVGTIWTLQQSQNLVTQGSSNLYLSHQVKGLTDVGSSTAGNHGRQFSGGLTGSLSAPLGRGLGYTTLAASKFGNESGNTEFDISNMFVTLGPLGGIFYLVILGTAFKMMFAYWQRTRKMVVLSLIGLAFLFLGHWLEAGSTGGILFWFSLGVVDRTNHVLEQAQVIEQVQEGEMNPHAANQGT